VTAFVKETLSARISKQRVNSPLDRRSERCFDS
jgi:hypothetical protein